MYDNENDKINPILAEFLDAELFDDKAKILQSTPLSDFDDLLIDNMASSIDVVIPDGPIDTRIMDLKNCVRTHAKYETVRFRR